MKTKYDDEYVTYSEDTNDGTKLQYKFPNGHIVDVLCNEEGMVTYLSITKSDDVHYNDENYDELFIRYHPVYMLIMNMQAFFKEFICTNHINHIEVWFEYNEKNQMTHAKNSLGYEEWHNYNYETGEVVIKTSDGKTMYRRCPSIKKHKHTKKRCRVNY